MIRQSAAIRAVIKRAAEPCKDDLWGGSCYRSPPRKPSLKRAKIRHQPSDGVITDAGVTGALITAAHTRLGKSRLPDLGAAGASMAMVQSVIVTPLTKLHKQVGVSVDPNGAENGRSARHLRQRTRV